MGWIQLWEKNGRNNQKWLNYFHCLEFKLQEQEIENFKYMKRFYDEIAHGQWMTAGACSVLDDVAVRKRMNLNWLFGVRQ